MLRETLKVAQVEGEHRRRWFNDEFFDLIVWFDELDQISGFQLCYNIDVDEHALTWHRGHGFTHHAVDPGDDPPGPIKMTPILLADGVFSKENIIERFIKESGGIDIEIASFVLDVLQNYPNKK